MTKAQARDRARARLAAIGEGERDAAAESIPPRLWTLASFRDARTILTYSALPDEIPTHHLARAARERGIRLVYPRCLPAGRLALHEVVAETDLAPGRFGILEPLDHCAVVRTEQIDAAIIPGLAWSGSGHRLGRGAGYYDRLLADPAFRGFRCGIFLEQQRMDDLPVDEWDMPLEAVVTEKGIVHVPAPGGADRPQP